MTMQGRPDSYLAALARVKEVFSPQKVKTRKSFWDGAVYISRTELCSAMLSWAEEADDTDMSAHDALLGVSILLLEH